MQPPVPVPTCCARHQSPTLEDGSMSRGVLAACSTAMALHWLSSSAGSPCAFQPSSSVVLLSSWVRLHSGSCSCLHTQGHPAPAHT
jgi:hypothetical protein